MTTTLAQHDQARFEDARADRALRTDHLVADLKGRSVRGGALTLAAQATRFAVTLIGTAVLARLLGPSEFGLVAMVTAITGFALLFRDLGLSQATVQRSDVTQAQVSVLFWLNVLIGAGLMLLTAALAPLIAWVYGEPRLIGITLALSGGLLLGGLGTQHVALLRRQMRYRALAATEIGSVLAAHAVAIVLAWRGAGYWAIVAQALVWNATNMVLAWTMSGWRPGLPRRRTEGVGSLVRFGANLTGFSVVNYFTRNADNMLIGWFWGAGWLGLYTRAYGLLLLPLHQLATPLTHVAVPALCRLQDNPARYRQYYRRALMPLLALTMPVVAFAMVQADNIIRLMLGEAWLEAGTLFRLLAPAAFIGTTYVATGWIYVSLGHAHRQFRWGLIASTTTVATFAACLPYGAAAVAAGFSAVTVLLRYPSIVYCVRGTHLSVRDVLSPMLLPALTSLAAAAVAWGASALQSGTHPYLELLIVGVLFTLAYATAWLVLPAGRTAAAEMLDVLKELRPGRRARPVVILASGSSAAPAAT